MWVMIDSLNPEIRRRIEIIGGVIKKGASRVWISLTDSETNEALMKLRDRMQSNHYADLRIYM